MVDWNACGVDLLAHARRCCSVGYDGGSGSMEASVLVGRMERRNGLKK